MKSQHVHAYKSVHTKTTLLSLSSDTVNSKLESSPWTQILCEYNFIGLSECSTKCYPQMKNISRKGTYCFSRGSCGSMALARFPVNATGYRT